MKKLLLVTAMGVALMGMSSVASADGKNKVKWQERCPDKGGECVQDSSFKIQGYIPCKCDLYVNSTNKARKLFKGDVSVESAQIASVDASCNTKDGFMLSLESEHGGLVNADGDLILYNLDFNGMGWVSSADIQEDLVTNAGVYTQANVQNAGIMFNADGSNAYAGKYKDYITVTIAGIL